MKEKIVKLINSGNREDIIIGMHLLGQYKWEEIRSFFRENFEKYHYPGDHQERYKYNDCIVATQFIYGKNKIYVGQTLLTLDMINTTDTPEIKIR